MPGRRGPARRPIGLTQATQPSRGTIVVSRASYITNATVGDAAITESPFTITNLGPGPWANPQVSVSYGSGSSWLSLATVTNQDGSITVTPTITPGANTAGTKTATVTITDSKVLNSGVTVTFSLVLAAAAPILSLSTTSLVLTVQDETTGPAATLTITNTGGSTASTPAVGTITGTAATYLGTPAITGTGPWTLTVTPNATGGTPGTYAGVIPITLTGATTVNVNVSLTVSAQAQALLRLTRATGDALFTTGGTTPAPETASLFSGNATPLLGPVIDSQTITGVNTGFATASLNGTQLTVTYDTSAPNVANNGLSRLRTIISDPAAGNTETHDTFLVVNTTASPTNTLVTSTTAVTYAINTGDSLQAQTITVSNGGTGGLSGLGTVTATLTSSVAWVSAAYVAGTSTGTVTLTFVTAGLTAGTYSNTLTIAASGADNSPRTIPIQIVVAAASTVPLLPFTLPIGVTQDQVTGAISGRPQGILSSRPSNWNSAATYQVTAASTPTPSAYFQNCLTASQSQNSPVIEIDAGLTLVGNFTVGARTGTGWLVIRTASYASLPATGTRVLPTVHDQYMPTISSPNALPVMRMTGVDTRTYFLGLVITDTATASLGDNIAHVVSAPNTYSAASNTVSYANVADQSNQPTDIWFDQVIGKGKVTGGSRRFLAASNKRLAITDSYLYEYKKNGNECQAILVSYGGYSYYFDNTYFEAAGENFMAGGLPLPYNDDAWNPRDLYFNRCEFGGRWKWFAWHPDYAANGSYNVAAKNLFELKRGKRVLLNACVFHETGVDAQGGTALMLKSDNNGSNSNPVPNATADVQVLNCWIYDSQSSWAIAGNASPAGGTCVPNDRHAIINMLCSQLNIPPNNSSFYLTGVQNGASNIVIDRVTHVQTAAGAKLSGIMQISGAPCSNITWTNTILPTSTYGAAAQGAPGFGKAAMDYAWSGGYSFHHNVVGTPTQAGAFPSGNSMISGESVVGYVNYGGTQPADFALASSSPYYTASTFGGAIGCDMAALATAISGVVNRI